VPSSSIFTTSITPSRPLIVPGLYAADEGLLTRINDYIARGGRALIGFKSGFSDENVKVRSSAQPGVLRQSCGVSYSQFTLPEETTEPLHRQRQ
ncbi:hypothetical protein FK513_31650, partial [Klebsiella pneumoniae]|uniref:beta-galactosidase trimerization domain-containing protein n=1 Tax=Klebsiella pneumoniae TaxID=573 RepID=UPI00210E1008